MKANLRSVNTEKNADNNIFIGHDSIFNADQSKFLAEALAKSRLAEKKPSIDTHHKDESLFQLLERALMAVELLFQSRVSLANEHEILKKKYEELEQKRSEWQKIAVAAIDQGKQSERLRQAMQAQLEERALVAEMKVSESSNELADFSDRIWSLFCRHSQSYNILECMVEEPKEEAVAPPADMTDAPIAFMQRSAQP
jgi:hypothetical protein